MTTRENELKLNPGAPRRKAGSLCKCLLVTLALAIVLFSFMMLTTFIWTFVGLMRAPHQWMYQNATLDEIRDLSTVVRPLIDDQQTFDVAATVWIRTSNEESSKEDAGVEVNRYSTNKDAGLNPEEVLFSDIVFRNITLKDKMVLTSVQFQVPATIFKSGELTNYDLRGSFVLIPSSPSLIDYAVNYSSWIPASIKMPPSRPAHFPLGSVTERPHTLSEELIDTLGINIPLLQFYDINSRCVPSNTTFESGTSVNAEEDGQEADADDDDESDDVTEVTKEEKNDEGDVEKKPGTNLGSKLESIKGKSPIQWHPYLITRTQLRVVDFTRLYNRKAYNRAHKDLKANACGQGVSKANRSWDLCILPPLSSGHSQTRVHLKVPNETTGKNHTEWAYGPYLTTINGGGPKDLLLVPVNRENCSTYTTKQNTVFTALPDEEFMNVTWKISYSGRTPGKLGLGTVLNSYNSRYNMTESEYKRAASQADAELMHGLLGHRFRADAHPRRTYALVMFGAGLLILGGILDMYYWYTRTSTFGVSIPGTSLMVLALSLPTVISVISGKDNLEPDQLIVIWVFSHLFTWIRQLSYPALMLKAITRTELGLWMGFIPTLRIAPATHKERASARLDAQFGWRAKAVVLLGLSTFYYLANPYDHFTISWKGPIPPADSELSGLGPLIIGSLLFQFLLNRRLRTFAGMYKSSLAIRWLHYLVTFSEHTPILVGRPVVLQGQNLHDFIEMCCYMLLAWQAVTLPSVSQTAEDDDVD